MLTGGTLLSTTRIVKFAVPVVVGVPAMTPLASVNPAGNEPVPVSENVYGAVPFVALSAWEYGVDVAPMGNGDAVVMVSPAATVIVIAFVVAGCGGLLESTILTVKLKIPVWVAVPLIVAPVKFNPLGKAPALIDQV